MPDLMKIRVRIFEPTELRPLMSDVDLVAAARAAVAGNPTLAATVETEGGDGPAPLVQVGASEPYWTDWKDDVDRSDLVIRLFEVEDAYEDIGPSDDEGLGIILAGYDEIFYDEGVEGIRLLTAEEITEDGSLIVRAMHWYNSTEYAQGLVEMGYGEEDE
jgi:hypothetical protein